MNFEFPEGVDIGMPEEDGYMLLRSMRAWLPEQGGQIPAIALTAQMGLQHIGDLVAVIGVVLRNVQPRAKPTKILVITEEPEPWVNSRSS